MNPAELFQKLLPRISAIAFKRSRGHVNLQDDLMGVAGLAFWVAWLDRKRCRIKLEDWLILAVQNSVQNASRGMFRRQRWEWLMANERLDELFGRWDLSPDLDLSEDAKGAAWVLIMKGMGEGRRHLYREIGYEASCEAIRELRRVLA